MRLRLIKTAQLLSVLGATGMLCSCSPAGIETGGTITPGDAVVTTSPTEGATNVAVDSGMTITFSIAAAPDSLDGSLQPDIGFTVAWSADAKTLTVTPDGALDLDVQYTVTITSLQFTNGTTLSGSYTFSFTTGDGGDDDNTDNGTVTDKMALWTVGQTQLRGAVVHPCTLASDADAEMTCNETLSRADLDDLKALGANLIQASYPGLYNQQAPYGVNETAQAYLDSLLTWAAEVDLFVVIAIRTGPGRNEAQITGFGEPHSTVWTDQAAHDAWVDMWRYMAERYRDNPVVAGYDVMVEPHVNTLVDPNSDLSPTAFQQQHAGTLADWNAFAAEITDAIREVDTDTPIIISSLSWGNVEWLSALEPTGDDATVYTIHAYDPDIYTHQDTPDASVSYPSVVEDEGETISFDRAWLAAFHASAAAFSTTHDVPIYVGEYGAMRWLPGAANFVADQVSLFEANGWNYTYYVWRGDEPTFDGFNMEYGTDFAAHSAVTPNAILTSHTGHWPDNAVTPSTVPEPDQNEPGTRMTLPEVRFWAYQIQQLEADGAVDALVASSYDLLVLEPTRSDANSTEFDTAGMVDRLHASAASSSDRTKLVVAYIDIGQAEDWRTYWAADWVAPTATEIGSPDFLITIDPDGWAGNYPVAYWDERWKAIMIDGDNSVLQQLLDDGFDGIYMDWVEAYSDTSVMAAAGGLDPAAEMVDFIREIRTFARAQNPDFLIIPQNAAEIVEFGGQDYYDIIDGIAQEQIYFDGNADTDWDEPDSGDHRVQDTCPADDDECGYSREFYEGWLADYLDAGKVVLSVDYAGEASNAAEAYQNASANGFIPYVSRRPLDRLTDTLPPGMSE